MVPAHWRDARCRVQLSEPVPGVAYQVISIITIIMMMMVMMMMMMMSLIHSELHPFWTVSCDQDMIIKFA